MYNENHYPHRCPYCNSTLGYLDNRNNYTDPYYFNTSQYTHFPQSYEYPQYYQPPQEYFNSTNLYRDALGTRWVGQEKQWRWTWTRRGDSNVFDAVYTHPHDNPIYATIFITLNGNQVTAQRRQANEGGDCDYVGVIQGNSVSGTYTCQQGTGTVWSATIEGGTSQPPDTGDTTGVSPVSFEKDFLNGVVKVKGTVYPDQNKIHVEGYIFGVNVTDETYTLEDRELVYERTQMGTKVKLVVGLKPSGKTIYARGEMKIGGRIVGEFKPTTLASW